ncbi:hypothetical protein Tco_1236862 [Tanacetum coccineum]
MKESEDEQTKRTKLQQEQDRLRHEAAVRLQEKLDKEERQRMARVHKAAQSFTEEEWENIRARVEADEKLTHRLQAEERNNSQATITDFAEVGSSKRAAEVELNHEGSKKQKTNEASGVGNHSESYQFFEEILKVFDRDDLVMLWSLVKERFSSTEPTDDKERALWVELKRLFEPDANDELWKLQRYMNDPLTWRLYDTCGVHHVSTEKGMDIFMLVEKEYPLSKGIMIVMLVNKLKVDQHSEMENELLRKIFIQIWMTIISLGEDCWELNLSRLVLPREEFIVPSLVSTARVEDSTARLERYAYKIRIIEDW